MSNLDAHEASQIEQCLDLETTRSNYKTRPNTLSAIKRDMSPRVARKNNPRVGNNQRWRLTTSPVHTPETFWCPPWGQASVCLTPIVTIGAK